MKSNIILLLKKFQKNTAVFLENFSSESMIWYSYHKHKTNTEIQNSEEVLDLLKETELFYPSIFSAICISLTIPATTCTAERSFSTMRRVKTWLRSTMTDMRLDALCMMNVHKKTIKKLISDNFYVEIVDHFGRDSRRLQFILQK